jgi:hypothetical protein
MASRIYTIPVITLHLPGLASQRLGHDTDVRYHFLEELEMGANADAMSRFAQPLIDATDGSPEDLQRALSLSQLCWNLALIPEGKREQFPADMQPILGFLAQTAEYVQQHISDDMESQIICGVGCLRISETP